MEVLIIWEIDHEGEFKNCRLFPVRMTPSLYINLLKKRTWILERFALLRHFVPSLFQLWVRALLSGSKSPVWTQFAKNMFKNLRSSRSEHASHAHWEPSISCWQRFYTKQMLCKIPCAVVNTTRQKHQTSCVWIYWNNHYCFNILGAHLYLKTKALR